MLDKEKVKTGFYGTVLLKDAFRCPISHHFSWEVSGLIAIHKDEEITGFKVSKTESNWVVSVKGQGANYFFLGCQVRGFVEHGNEPCL